MSTERRRASSATAAWADAISIFAGVLLVVAGTFQILQGIAAIADDEIYSQGAEWVYRLDTTTWGVIHLTLGVLSVVIGVGVAVGRSWAHVAGIAISVLAMIGNFAFLPHYPFWAITVIAIEVLVIWALSFQLGRTR